MHTYMAHQESYVVCLSLILVLLVLNENYSSWVQSEPPVKPTMVI